MAVAGDLMKFHFEKTGKLLPPEDFNRNLNAQLPQIKKLMKLNIIADEFLDALMYGNIRLFTCLERDKDVHSDYAVALRPELVDMMEEIGQQFCVEREGEPIELTDLFYEIHQCLSHHLQDLEVLSESEDLTHIFKSETSRIATQLKAQMPDPSAIQILQELERLLILDMHHEPIHTWDPQKREFFMTFLFLKCIISWQTEPHLRNISGCPMLYSRQLIPWLKKGTQPIKDWYAKAFDGKDGVPGGN